MEPIDLVVLAAGKGTRFLPLTETTPKPLLKIAGKSTLEHTLLPISESFHKIIFVVGHLEEQFRKRFGDTYNNIPVQYVTQAVQNGTANALIAARNAIETPKFVVMNADDLYDKALFDLLLSTQFGIIGVKTPNWQYFGVITKNSDNYLSSIVEKPDEMVSDLANVGVYKLGVKIFELAETLRESKRGELELTDLVTEFAKTVPIEVVTTQAGWYPLSYPWDALTIAEYMLSRIQPAHLGTVEQGAVIKGKVWCAKSSLIKAGAYLEGNFYIGENCVIGPNCYLKGFGSFGDGCTIGNAVEITRSILLDGVNVRHLSYVGDSIIGNNVNLGAGTAVANLRFDDKTIKSMINDTLIDTGRQKLGALLGDNVKTGINSAIMPGVKIHAGGMVFPLEIVGKDKTR